MSRNYSGRVNDLTIPSWNEAIQSVEGSKEPHQAYNTTLVPSTGFGQPVLQTREVMLGMVKYKKAPNTLSTVIKMKSVNGVLPCRSITHHILRGPAPNPNNQQAPQGIARGQRRGLAYGMDWQKHNIQLNAPVLARPSSVWRNGNSLLGKGLKL